jgi:hypothetical protein
MKIPQSVEPLSNTELDALLDNLNVYHEYGLVWLGNVQVNFNNCNEWVVRNYINHAEKLGNDQHPDINHVFAV